MYANIHGSFVLKVVSCESFGFHNATIVFHLWHI